MHDIQPVTQMIVEQVEPIKIILLVPAHYCGWSG